MKSSDKSIRRCQFLGKNPQDGATVKGGLPLKHQEVNISVDNAVAVMDVVQTFINDRDHPLEVSLKFPIEKEHALGGLTIQIGDDIIEGKVLKKEKAQERYEDAIASGHTAVTAEESKDDPDMVTLKVGNLLEGQEAVIRFRLLHVLRIEAGSYVVRVPISFFPSADDVDYAFSLRADLKADAAIVYVSGPEGAVVTRDPENPLHVSLERPAVGGKTLKD